MSKHLLLYSHNIPVRGKDRAAIYNLQAGRLVHIPNSMVDLIEFMREESFGKARAAVDSVEIFKEHVDFLTKNDLVFFTDKPEWFSPISYQFFSPEHISNAVIEVDLTKNSFIEIIKELDEMLCKHLELRVVNTDFQLSHLKDILRYTNKTTIRSIEIHLENNTSLKKSELTSFIHDYPKIRSVIVHGSDIKSLDFLTQIHYLDDNWKQDQYGHFPEDIFIVNTKFFMESQQFNCHLNKKICVTAEGYIKNSLSQRKEYGIYGSSNTLFDALNHEQFKSMWHVTPDMIEGLREQETRYARFYTQEIELKNGKYYLVN